MLKKYESPDLFVINFHSSDALCASYPGSGDDVVTPVFPISLDEADIY